MDILLAGPIALIGYGIVWLCAYSLAKIFG